MELWLPEGRNFLSFINNQEQNVSPIKDLTLEQISFLRDTFTRNWTWTEDDIEEDLIKAIGFYNERTQYTSS